MKTWLLLAILSFLLMARSGEGAALKIAGELSQVRGHITVRREGQIQPRSVARFALLHEGDVVSVATGASAQVNLGAEKLGAGGLRYSLSGDSRLRVLNGHLLSLFGPGPQALTASQSAEVLPAELFDRSRESEVVRGDGQWGPKNPSPVFAVRGPEVTLGWDGPINPDDAPPGEGGLRVRIKEIGASRWVFTQDLSPDARSITLPVGTLLPGRWYSWSVKVVGPGDLPAAGGPLCLLTPSEQSELTDTEQEIASEYPGRRQAAQASQTQAEAYASFGLVEDALKAYQTAQRIGGSTDSAKEIVRLNALLSRAQPGADKE